jgi:hypothetical protein
VTLLLIVVPVEGEPVFIVDALDEAEEARLNDWLRSSLVLARVAHQSIALLADLLDEEENDPEAAA